MNKRWLIGGAVLVVLLIPAAAYLLFSSRQAKAQQGGEEGERVMVLAVEQVVNGESYGGEVRVRYEDPPELPSQAAQASGLFLGLDGSTLELGTGSIEVQVEVRIVNDEEPDETVNARHSGDEITVQVDADTVILEDTTPRPEITPADIEAGEKTIVRSVAPGSLDRLSENMLVRVWGSWQGDVLLADLVVYEAIR